MALTAGRCQGELPSARENHLVHSFEFIIGRGKSDGAVEGPDGDEQGDEAPTREVNVSVEMTIEGMIKVTVDAGESADTDSGAPPSALLYVWIVLLFVLYVAAKLAFSTVEADLQDQAAAQSTGVRAA